jgi:restriction system protein
MFGQYIVPAAFLLGAVGAAIARAKKKRLLATTAAATSRGAVKYLSWHEVELLVGEAFRQKGYSVQETKAGADGGVDLELRKDGEPHFVQCKQWRGTKVGVAVVRELFGAMAGRGATHGYVVTSGASTKEARIFAEGRNITLIDGDALDTMLKRTAPKMDESKRMTAGAMPESGSTQTTVATKGEAVPACPLCGSLMVKRLARQGTNAGTAFWGCKSFPKCRGTRKV